LILSFTGSPPGGSGSGAHAARKAVSGGFAGWQPPRCYLLPLRRPPMVKAGLGGSGSLGRGSDRTVFPQVGAAVAAALLR
jgi:hypothetical protein